MPSLFANRGFRIHAIIYAIVNALLLVVDLATSPQSLWFYWPLLGWGLGLLAHAYFEVRASRSTVPAAPGS